MENSRLFLERRWRWCTVSDTRTESKRKQGKQRGKRTTLVSCLWLKMPQYCCVPMCTNSGGHRFPKDESIKLKWRVAIKRIDPQTKQLWMPGDLDVVCKMHFLPSDYTETLMGNHCHIK